MVWRGGWLGRSESASFIDLTPSKTEMQRIRLSSVNFKKKIFFL